MATFLLLSHEVKDYDLWKKGFDAHGSVRDAAGFKLDFVGRDEGNPKLVHISMKVPSADAAKAFLANPQLKEVMAAAGVVSAPTTRIVVT